jgi:hypothetical protein
MCFATNLAAGFGTRFEKAVLNLRTVRLGASIGHGPLGLLSSLLATLRRPWRFDRSFQFRHPRDEIGQEASVPPQFLITDVQLLLRACHLVSQSLNKRSISLDLILTSSLPSSSSHTRTVQSDLSEMRDPRAMRFLTASVLMPGSRAASPRKTGAIILQFALVYYWCTRALTQCRGLGSY